MNKITRVAVFFIVFIISIIITTKLFSDGSTNVLFINLLVSGLLASISYWFAAVWHNRNNTGN